MVFDKINQSRCKERSVKRGQKCPEVVHADHNLIQPAVAVVAPFCKNRGTIVEGKLFIRSFGMSITDEPMDTIEIFPHPFPPTLHCQVGRSICSEWILLCRDFVHDILNSISYVMLIWSEVLWKLSMQFSAFGAFETADHAMVGPAIFSAADPATLVTILQWRAATWAVMVFILAFNRKNSVLRLEDNSLV